MTEAQTVVPDDSGAFNPLETEGVPAEMLLRLQQSTVANIRDSYHGRYDSFAEAVQNAVDAVAKRWSSWEGPGSPVPGGEDEERPQIRVIIDCTSETVQVIDNGTGMDDGQLRESLVPNVSLKYGDLTQRGHKGVGTTYLTYGHDLFEVESKTAAGTHGYRLIQGLAWVQSVPPDPAPSFDPVASSAVLADFGSGTAVKMRFGPGSNYGNLTGTFYNSPKLWEVVLRSYTAIGLISLRPSGTSPAPWEEHATITLELKGVASSGVKNVPFSFMYPHENLDYSEVAELQALQNNPGGTTKFKLIYLSRDHQGLMQLLQPELGRLAHDNTELHEEITESLQKGEISAYASLGYKNTLYDELWKKSIGQTGASRLTAINVKGGVLVASVGMPIGEILPHLQLQDPGIGQILKPEERRRYFLLVHFNHTYRPDIGRKTIPRNQERIIGWLEAAIIRVLRPYAKRLQVTNEDATHNAANFAQAQQQLQDAQAALTARDTGATTLALPGLIPARQAFTETEVTTQFASLLSQKYLDGYAITAFTGSESRYDGLFSVECDTPAEDMAGVNAVTGISKDMFFDGAYRRTNQWLEFKLSLADLIDEFELSDGEPNKKYYTQVNLVVCWAATGTSEAYGLLACDESSWRTRSFPGTTHFLVQADSDHRVEVIALETLIPTLIDAIA